MESAKKYPGLPIIWREHANEVEYETARVGRVFNHRRPKRYPTVIVEAESEDHIVAAVKIAKELGARVSIRSGGHSWAAWSVRDDAVLVDLGKFKHISIDEEAMVASVSPSTTGSMLNDQLSARKLMFAGGHCPDVGLGGFLLQVALDVVSAEGEIVRVDSEHNSDLLWAAKGAGPGFPAIVTRFYLKIRPQPKAMLSSTFIYPISKYTEVMNWVIKLTPTFDQDTEIVAVSNTPPGINEKCIIGLFVVFKDSEEDCKMALEPANETRPEGFILELQNKETSLAKEYRDQAGANPHGHRYCAENGYVKNDVDVAAVLEPAFTTLPHPKAFALWYAMAPCSRRNMPDMALSMQSDHYFALYTIWENEGDDERCQKWVKDVMQEVAPHCEGAYLGDSDFQVRQTKYWTDEKAKKLMEIRRTRDPNGRICGYLDHGDQSGVRGLLNTDSHPEIVV